MARRPKAPKPIPITTLRAITAAHALGLTHWGQASGTTDWAIDDAGLIHAVLRRTTRGNRQVAHACGSYRNTLALKMQTMNPMSREYIYLELTIVSSAWLCDVAGEFIDCPDTDDIMTTAGLYTAVEVSE